MDGDGWRIDRGKREMHKNRTHQNFQESFLKIPQDNIYDFPGGKNIIRTHDFP